MIGWSYSSVASGRVWSTKHWQASSGINKTKPNRSDSTSWFSLQLSRASSDGIEPSKSKAHPVQTSFGSCRRSFLRLSRRLRKKYKTEHCTKLSLALMFDAIRRLQFTPGTSSITVQFWQKHARSNPRIVLTVIQDVVDNNLPYILSGTHQAALAHSGKPEKYRGVADALIEIAAQCLLMA